MSRAAAALATAGFIILVTPSAVHAYVGPGGVITAIGAFVALVVALVAALVGFVWLPLKGALIWARGLRAGESGGAATTAGSGPDGGSGV